MISPCFANPLALQLLQLLNDEKNNDLIIYVMDDPNYLFLKVLPLFNKFSNSCSELAGISLQLVVSICSIFLSLNLDHRSNLLGTSDDLNPY